MKNKKRIAKKIIITIFTVCIIFIASVYAILKQQIIIVGKANINTNEQETQDYEVTYIIKNKWYNNGKYYYEISMTLHNNTNSTLNGWKIQINVPEDAELLNNYNVAAILQNNTILFENLSYNAEIDAKSSVTFAFQISTETINYEPNNIIINGNIISPPKPPEQPDNIKKEVEIQLKKENSWQSEQNYYSQYTVTITNIGETTIYGWQFDLSEKVEIEQIWNATKIDNTTISNSEYNGIIAQNSQTSFSFIIKTTDPDIELKAINIVLK